MEQLSPSIEVSMICGEQTHEHKDRSIFTFDEASSRISSLCWKPGTANENGVIRQYMAQTFIEDAIEPLHLDKASLNTAFLFCRHLENMISKVWEPANICAERIKSELVTEGSDSDGSIDMKVTPSN
jgi:hypothetical protein